MDQVCDARLLLLGSFAVQVGVQKSEAQLKELTTLWEIHTPAQEWLVGRKRTFQ